MIRVKSFLRLLAAQRYADSCPAPAVVTEWQDGHYEVMSPEFADGFVVKTLFTIVYQNGQED